MTRLLSPYVYALNSWDMLYKQAGHTVLLVA